VTVKIGINPNSWTLDDVPELRHFTSLEDRPRRAAESGSAGIERGGNFTRTATELRLLCGDVTLNARYRKAS
jgi:inosose dehydratase